MRITALVRDPEHVCCRYRLEAFRPFFEKAGYHLDVRSYPRKIFSWLRIRRDLRSADVVILQRKLPQSWQLNLLRQAARRLCYDFDDAVHFRDSYASKGLHSPRRLSAFTALVDEVDAVVAGNAFLHQQASAATHPHRVEIIPTCVDPSRYPMAEHQRVGPGVELVWIGSSSTLQGLEAIRPLLESLGQNCPGLRLKLVCDRFITLDSMPVLPCPWSERAEIAELRSADIGISWIPDDDWSRGKCGLKILQYMAAGLPVIANPVGVQTTMVRHGETGFLARTPEEWRVAVGRLAGDPGLRQSMGRAGRRLVERDYGVEIGAARWLTLLARLRSDSRRTG